MKSNDSKKVHQTGAIEAYAGCKDLEKAEFLQQVRDGRYPLGREYSAQGPQQTRRQSIADKELNNKVAPSPKCKLCRTKLRPFAQFPTVFCVNSHGIIMTGNYETSCK